MNPRLNDRLRLLETAQQAPALDPAKEAERQERAGREISEFIEQMKQKQAEYEAMSAHQRIRHWQGKISEAQSYIAVYGNEPPPMPPWSPVNEFGFKSLPASVEESFHRTDWLLRLKGAKDNLRGKFQYELTTSRLDRLSELGYDPVALKPWQDKVARFKSIPWQWLTEYIEFPADALARLEVGQQAM